MRTCGISCSPRRLVAVVAAARGVGVGRPIGVARTTEAAIALLNHLEAAGPVRLVVEEAGAFDVLAAEALRRGLPVWVASHALTASLCAALGIKPTAARRLAAVLARLPDAPPLAALLRRVVQPLPDPRQASLL